MTHATREDWLLAAMIELQRLFPAAFAGTDFGPVRVSCGWPRLKRGRGGRGVDTIGQYWPAGTASDSRPQIFISPRLDAAQALETLLHEMIHHATPGDGHRGRFGALASLVGFLVPWHETPPTPELRQLLATVLDVLGPYPHGTLTPGEDKAPNPGSRLRLWECACTPKPVKVRVASDSFAAICLVCGSEFRRPDSPDSPGEDSPDED